MASRSLPDRPTCIVWDLENCRLPDSTCAEPAEVVNAIRCYVKKQAEAEGRERVVHQFVAARTFLNSEQAMKEEQALYYAGIPTRRVHGKQRANDKHEEADAEVEKASIF
jgi:hypothetical protein